MLGHRNLTPNEYVSILKRRWILVLLPALILPLVAFGVSYLIPPQYVSQTLVLIEQQKVADDYVKPVIASDLDARLASMKEQILSRSRIQPIIERFNLYPNKNMDDRIAEARKNIDVKPIRSDIGQTNGLPGFYISFKAGDPHTAQQVCGEITSLFVNEDLRDREQSAQGTTDFLQSQLAEAKSNLDSQDKKLADFQRQYVGKLPGQEQPNMDMLTSLNTQLQATTQQLQQMQENRTYLQTLLSQQQKDVSVGNVTVSTSDPREQQLEALEAQEADLTARYTPDYPDVISVKRKIADLKRQIAHTPMGSAGGPARAPESMAVSQMKAQLQAADSAINQKRAEQAQIQGNIRTYQDRIASTPLVEEQYKELTRGYDEAKKFYDDLLAKMNQSKMATDLQRRQQGEQFNMVDAPNLPDAPTFPKRPLFALGGFALGLLIGVAIVAFLEYRDTAIRTEDDVNAFLKLPTLAIISASNSLPVAHNGRGLGASKKRLFSRKEALAEVRG